jgi:hypothetical protein
VITTKELAIQKHQTSLRFFEVQSGALVKERYIVLNFGKISANNKTEQLGTEYKTYLQTATRNDEALLYK